MFQLKINVGTLKDQKEDLASFLEPRVGTKPSVSGDAIEVEDGSIRKGVRPRHVKTYIKRFMHMKGLRQKYRVFVAGSELTIQEIELSEKEEEEKKEAEKKAKTEEKLATTKEEVVEQGAEAPAAKEEQTEQKPAKKTAKKPRSKKATQED